MEAGPVLVIPDVDQIHGAELVQDAPETASGETGEAIGASDVVPDAPVVDVATEAALSPLEQVPDEIPDSEIPF